MTSLPKSGLRGFLGVQEKNIIGPGSRKKEPNEQPRHPPGRNRPQNMSEPLPPQDSNKTPAAESIFNKMAIWKKNKHISIFKNSKPTFQMKTNIKPTKHSNAPRRRDSLHQKCTVVSKPPKEVQGRSQIQKSPKRSEKPN